MAAMKISLSLPHGMNALDYVVVVINVVTFLLWFYADFFQIIAIFYFTLRSDVSTLT